MVTQSLTATCAGASLSFLPRILHRVVKWLTSCHTLALSFNVRQLPFVSGRHLLLPTDQFKLPLQSGFFYKHPMLAEYDYCESTELTRPCLRFSLMSCAASQTGVSSRASRCVPSQIEPRSTSPLTTSLQQFYCDLAYDPFLAMMDKGAVYGFTLSLFEYVETVPTLWEETKKFLASRPDLAPLMEGNAMKFLSDDNGETYNLVSRPGKRAQLMA